MRKLLPTAAGLVALTLGLLAVPLEQTVADTGGLELAVERRGSALQVRATIPADAPAGLCYEVIADFDRLADFVPGLRMSRIVSVPGAPLELRQVGETTLGLSRYTIDVTLALATDPPHGIRFRRIAGNLEAMDGSWQVTGDDARCVIDYRATLEPSFWVPPLLGPLLVRRQVEVQLHGLQAEIGRRARATRPAAPGRG